MRDVPTRDVLSEATVFNHEEQERRQGFSRERQFETAAKYLSRIPEYKTLFLHPSRSRLPCTHRWYTVRPATGLTGGPQTTFPLLSFARRPPDASSTAGGLPRTTPSAGLDTVARHAPTRACMRLKESSIKKITALNFFIMYYLVMIRILQIRLESDT